ncbi:MAG: ROK family protein, partial [FCB group bacterium]|nr:ROK family protein [FCB group bacterium]
STTKSEQAQEMAFLEASVKAIQACIPATDDRPILIGMGLPGLKTPDQRGIAAMANGPRMPEFASRLEAMVQDQGIRLARPIHRLGSDADYCGIGEEYAVDGNFSAVRNAYYLGGGTGAADALKLNGKLVPLDHTKTWLAKTWELKSDEGLSLERFASAGGIQAVYAQISGRNVNDVIAEKIYPDVILDRAVQHEPAATETMNLVARRLADLLAERIVTTYRGWTNQFSFINPRRAALISDHPYLGVLFDRIVIGQRLADLLRRSRSTSFLWKPLLDRLSQHCSELDSVARNHYVQNARFREDRLVLSNLRSAPVLGAGVDAWLNANPDSHA